MFGGVVGSVKLPKEVYLMHTSVVYVEEEVESQSVGNDIEWSLPR